MLRRIVRKLLWLDDVPPWAREHGPAALLPLRLITFGVLFCLIGILIMVTGGLFGWRSVWDIAALVGVTIFILGILFLFATIVVIAVLRTLGKL
jgi:uncharacterized membrane protein